MNITCNPGVIIKDVTYIDDNIITEIAINNTTYFIYDM